MRPHKIKGSNQVVFSLHNAGKDHTMCVFPVDGVTRKGNRAVTQPVRNDKLVKLEVWEQFDATDDVA